MELDIIYSIIFCIWLLLCSLQDIRRKYISLFLIGMGFVGLFSGSIIIDDLSLWNRLAGLSLGLVLLSLNPITKGQIGIGDGLIVSITGLCLGFTENAVLLVYGLIGSALLSMILLLFFRVNRKKSIPFVPFLLFGYLGVLSFG